MNSRIFKLLVGGLFVVLATATAYAQESGTVLRANIPFDFNVRGKMLPAGTYMIKEAQDEPETLVIANVYHKRDLAMFETESVEARKSTRHSEIIFNHLGDQYFLSEVFDAGSRVGLEATPSRQERALKREMASRGGSAESAIVSIMAE
jgi:hypothetical protein